MIYTEDQSNIEQYPIHKQQNQKKITFPNTTLLDLTHEGCIAGWPIKVEL